MWLNNVRALSVFAVVLLHVSSEYVSGIDVSNPLYGSYSWWVGDIYGSITRWCVPLFVMISGYLLLNKTEAVQDFFQKRLKKILIPVLFWSLFFSLWMLLKSFVRNELSDAPLELAKAWLLGVPYYHLWCLFMIPFLYLVTPILRHLFNSASKDELFAFICFCFALAIIYHLSESVLFHFDLNAKVHIFPNKFLSFLGYFCFGGYVAKYNISLKPSKCFIVLAIAWSATIFGTYFFTFKYFYSFLSITAVMASIAILFLIKHFLDKEIGLSGFAKLSFGIYLVHPVFLDVITSVAQNWLLGKIDLSIYIPLVTIMVFLLSYAASFVMSKIKFLNRCI